MENDEIENVKLQLEVEKLKNENGQLRNAVSYYVRQQQANTETSEQPEVKTTREQFAEWFNQVTPKKNLFEE